MASGRIYRNTVTNMLMAIGDRGHMLEPETQFLSCRSKINRTPSRWTTVARQLDQKELANLIRGFVIAERDLEWIGGSAAAGIRLYREFRTRFTSASVELADWVLRNRGKNEYIPFGHPSYATNYEEWLKEREIVRERCKVAAALQDIAKERAELRRKEKKVKYRLRKLQSAARGVEIRKLTALLETAPIKDRFKLVAETPIPIGAISKPHVDALLGGVDQIEDDAAEALMGKIKSRSKGTWSRLKRSLEQK